MSDKQKESIVGIAQVKEITNRSEIKDSVQLLLSQMNEMCRWQIPQNATIMIKVNICLLKGYETGATVDPFVARCIAEWFLQTFHPNRIYIGEADATELDVDIAFMALGWKEEFCNLQNVELVNLAKDELVSLKLEKGALFKDLEISRKYMEADFLISLGKLKTNDMTVITAILKNQFGITPVKYKAQYHNHLSEAIYDLNLIKIPDLSFVDGIIGMEGAGPVNGMPKATGLLIASNDPVSADHACARIMCITPNSIPPLREAVQRKLGQTKYKIMGKSIEEVKTRFVRTSLLTDFVQSSYISLRNKAKSRKARLSVKDPQSKSNKVRVGILGLGAASELLHLPALSAIGDCYIAAACEKDPSRAQRRLQQWKIPVIYEDYDEMLDKTELDAVFVCLPSAMHHNAVKKALDRGINVFCEKPMGMNSTEAHNLVKQANSSGLILTVGYSRMLHENYRKAKSLISSHKLGRLLQIRGALMDKGPYAGWIPRSDWFFNKEGGGLLYDSGCHLFSVLMNMLDDRIAEISAQSEATYIVEGLIDQICGTFRSSKGILGSFSLGWRTANESNAIELIGTGGSLIVDSYGLEEKIGHVGTLATIANKLQLVRDIAKTQISGIGASENNAYALEDKAFIKSILGEGEPLVSGKFAVDILCVLEAVRESMDKGSKVAVRYCE